MTSKNLTLPLNNTYLNTWDVPLNTNFSGINYALGGVTYISVTGQSGTKTMVGTYSSSYPYLPNGIGDSGAPVTSSPSYIPQVIIISGTLSSSVNYQLPSGICGQWSIYNNTTTSVIGSTVTFSVSGGGSIVLEQGKRRLIVSDGTNVSLANSPSDAQGTDGSLQFNYGNTYYGSSLNYVPSTGAFTLSPLTFTGVIDGSGNLTTTGSQPLYSGMVIKTSLTATSSVGTVISGSGTAWLLSSSTATASTLMYAFPASGGVALTINSYDGQYGQQIIAGTTAGSSKGLLIKAGTNASDYSLRITDSATTPVDRFSIDGYGSVTIAAPSTSSTLPALQISVPTAATKPALKSNGGACTTPVAVTFAASGMVVNCALSNVFTTTLDTSVTGAPSFTNPTEGQTINWFLKQSTGPTARTMTWPTTNWFWAYNGAIPTLSAGYSKTDILVATYLNGSWYASVMVGF